MALVTFTAITQHCLSHSHQWTCWILLYHKQLIFFEGVFEALDPCSLFHCLLTTVAFIAERVELRSSSQLLRLLADSLLATLFDTHTCWTPSLVKVLVSDQICQISLVLKYSTRNRIMRSGMFSTLSLERSPLSLSLQLRRIMHVFSESSAERERGNILLNKRLVPPQRTANRREEREGLKAADATLADWHTMAEIVGGAKK